MKSRKLSVVCALAMTLAFSACSDSGGGGGNPGGDVGGAGSDAAGGGGGDAGGGGTIDRPDLQADQPAELSFVGAGDRMILVNDSLNRRAEEFLEFDDDVLEEIRVELDGQPGRLDCEGSGSVTMEAFEQELDNPFSEAAETFVGHRFIFEVCSPADPGEGTGISGAFVTRDGTIDVATNGAADDPITYIDLGDPFTLASSAEMGQSIDAQERFSTARVFMEQSTRTRHSVVGQWTSSQARSASNADDGTVYVAEGAQFDVLGYEGVGDFKSLRGGDAAPAGGFHDRRVRVQVDTRSNERDDCPAAGRFDMITTRESLITEGPHAGSDHAVHEIVGANGVTARIEPRFETDASGVPIQEDGFVVTIDGDSEEFTAREGGERRDLIRSTCQWEFFGYSPI
jgi:hypothetical protein